MKAVSKLVAAGIKTGVGMVSILFGIFDRAALRLAVDETSDLACDPEFERARRRNRREDGVDGAVQPARGESVLDSLPVSDDYNIVITARRPGSIPTALWASSYIIYMEA